MTSETRKQIEYEEIFEPSVQSQIEKRPLSIREQIEEIMELAKELEKTANFGS